MISLVIKSKDKESMVSIKEKFHNALVGSPAYIESEIAICDRDDNSFYLAIGNDNDNDITKVINIEDFEDLSE